MIPVSKRLVLCLAASLAGCAGRATREPEAASPPADAAHGERFAFGLQRSASEEQPSSVQAQAAGNRLLGLFNVESLYQAQQADRRQDAATLGRHSLSQGLNTALTLPLGSPLQLGFSGRVEQRWTDAGLLTAQQRSAQARWSDRGLQLAVDARRSSEASAYGCEVDASLRAALPDSLRAASANAEGLQLGGQLCQRRLPGAVPQQARILSAQTGWNDDWGDRQLRISHAEVRDRLADGGSPGGSPGGGVELAAMQALDLAGWSLSQEFALRPAENTHGDAGWAARSQLSRRVLSLPVSASWQRSEAAIWSLGGAPTPGREASLGLDLSRPLQQWLPPTTDAKLSYHRFDPADRSAVADEQIRLGFSLGW